ncbi:MAG: NAD-dependent epimerase/dehydratase family protein [Betaproteobacteria bacterium]|nr:NAD-dependent epimerase/dehydratase family protein [Betaproteobacteria bacterium]
MTSLRITVTGANGFVGQALCAALHQSGHRVTAAVRTPIESTKPYPLVPVGDIHSATEWKPALLASDVVVHLAGRAHVMRDAQSDALALYRKINVEGSVRLAEQAAEAGVRRLIFMSSIKVNGEVTGERPFTEEDPPSPPDPYGISKLEAERALYEVCSRSRLELAILRPTLIYGFGAKGNLMQLMKAVDRGWPLPIGAVRNRRSLLGMGNLIGAVKVCLIHPAAAGATFLIADEQPVSSSQLAISVGHALGRPARLLPVPVSMLRLAGAMTGNSAAVNRLTSSLVVDSSKIRKTLGWRSTHPFEQGIADMVLGYREGA